MLFNPDNGQSLTIEAISSQTTAPRSFQSILPCNLAISIVFEEHSHSAALGSWAGSEMMKPLSAQQPLDHYIVENWPYQLTPISASHFPPIVELFNKRNLGF